MNYSVLLLSAFTFFSTLILNAQKVEKRPLSFKDFATWKAVNSMAISAAFPLIEAGLKVVMIDFGNEQKNSLKKGSTYFDLRTKSESNPIFDNLDDWEKISSSSPKLRAVTNKYIFADYHEKYQPETNNFILSGSLAAGGLSNAWGAGVGCFDEVDLEKFPITKSDLEKSYQDVAKRIGVSGVKNDDVSEFHGNGIELQSATEINCNAKKILNRYQKNPQFANSNDIKIGRNRIAVLSEKKKKEKLVAILAYVFGVVPTNQFIRQDLI